MTEMDLEKLTELRKTISKLEIIAELKNNSQNALARLYYQKAAMLVIKSYCMKYGDEHKSNLVKYYLNLTNRG